MISKDFVYNFIVIKNIIMKLNFVSSLFSKDDQVWFGYVHFVHNHARSCNTCQPTQTERYRSRTPGSRYWTTGKKLQLCVVMKLLFYCASISTWTEFFLTLADVPHFHCRLDPYFGGSGIIQGLGMNWWYICTDSKLI